MSPQVTLHLCLFFVALTTAGFPRSWEGGDANTRGALWVDSVAFEGPTRPFTSGGTFWNVPDKAPV